ncbi:NMT1-domain-containing protein [Polychaeton citri CBS 116435]|uniref:4-amino-5-hydroxymethyl-2-methylpyrimidine phosphate synthase n=1 Tax=Polychaeton citri CBS 116435 TaxID=1314669 RepID=A0A9P4URT3_9PEZI|nr:NMT1-domain-containing protein [Polychaeton citri CBS 116435]
MSTSETVRIALDWTPNTIHSGLFVAKELGFYSAKGLDVQLLPPDAAYSTTPAKRLEKGEVDLAIVPSESCIAYAESGKLKLQAIYAILQSDPSAIVSLRDKVGNIKDLGNGRTYGSYNARYEDAIVRAMVDYDGGKGDEMQIARSEGKLSLFDAVKEGRVDATWVMLPWEGVEAEQNGTALGKFVPEDYGVPYGYTMLIARNASSGSLSKEALTKFVAATKQGYETCLREPVSAVEVLSRVTTPPREKDFLKKSQEEVNKLYSAEGSDVGVMESKKWDTWVQWLSERGLLGVKDLKVDDLFTNEFSENSPK